MQMWKVCWWPPIFQQRFQRHRAHGAAQLLQPPCTVSQFLAISSALSFYDGYRRARGPANLIQAQRDYFGAHTYERLDHARGNFFHTDWTGSGGPATAGSYLA